MRELLILVIMPPVPTAVVESPADPMIRASIFSTTGMSSAVGSSEGFAVYRPSISERVTQRSADTRQLTSAASVSLSPNLISSTVVVSFSLTMGTTPSSTRRVSASRACRYEDRRAVSWRVSRTREVLSPAARNTSSYAADRMHCPTEAHACRLGMSAGLRSNPRCGAPQAMAPELTTTRFHPRPRSSEAWDASWAMKSRRSTRSRPTSVEEPILTTMVFDTFMGTLLSEAGNWRRTAAHRPRRRKRS